MDTFRLPLSICLIASLVPGSFIKAKESCPRTVGADKVFAEPWPQADTWFGSEALAVILPSGGVWSTTRPPAQISVKLVWYSAGFEPGMERDFIGQIERIDEGPNDAVVSRPTNAGMANEVWTIMTGISFKSAGCWRITGEFRGQSLEFVVETVDHSKWKSNQQEGE